MGLLFPFYPTTSPFSATLSKVDYQLMHNTLKELPFKQSQKYVLKL